MTCRMGLRMFGGKKKIKKIKNKKKICKLAGGFPCIKISLKETENYITEFKFLIKSL